MSALNFFENIVGQGEIAHNKQFLPFPRVFHLFGEFFAIFNKLEIDVCKGSIRSEESKIVC